MTNALTHGAYQTPLSRDRISARKRIDTSDRKFLGEDIGHAIGPWGTASDRDHPP
jgi:hypothetical protein